MEYVINKALFLARRVWAPLTLVLSLLTSCGAINGAPLQVALSAQAPQIPIKLDNGTPVYLRVSDDRSRQLIGYRGPAVSGGEITAAEDLSLTFQRPLRQGLTSLGFNVVNDITRTVTTLNVAIEALEYWHSSNVVTVAQARTVVERERQRIFERIYITRREHDRFPVPDAEVITGHLNGSVQNLIWKILADLELLQALQSNHAAVMRSTMRQLVRTIGGRPRMTDTLRQAAEVYKGLDVQFIVGYPTRTRADVQTRIIAQAIEKYLPGRHTVRNMPGAGSIVAANYLYTAANPKGSAGVFTIAVFSGDREVWKEMEAKGYVRFEWRKFVWLSGLHHSANNERFFIALPPGSPNEIVELVRAAFSNLAADPGYRAEIGKDGLSVMSAAEVESVVAEFYR